MNIAARSPAAPGRAGRRPWSPRRACGLAGAARGPLCHGPARARCRRGVGGPGRRGRRWPRLRRLRRSRGRADRGQRAAQRQRPGRLRGGQRPVARHRPCSRRPPLRPHPGRVDRLRAHLDARGAHHVAVRRGARRAVGARPRHRGRRLGRRNADRLVVRRAGGAGAAARSTPGRTSGPCWCGRWPMPWRPTMATWLRACAGSPPGSPSRTPNSWPRLRSSPSCAPVAPSSAPRSSGCWPSCWPSPSRGAAGERPRPRLVRALRR